MHHRPVLVIGKVCLDFLRSAICLDFFQSCNKGVQLLLGAVCFLLSLLTVIALWVTFASLLEADEDFSLVVVAVVVSKDDVSSL